MAMKQQLQSVPHHDPGTVLSGTSWFELSLPEENGTLCTAKAEAALSFPLLRGHWARIIAGLPQPFRTILHYPLASVSELHRLPMKTQIAVEVC